MRETIADRLRRAAQEQLLNYRLPSDRPGDTAFTLYRVRPEGELPPEKDVKGGEPEVEPGE